MARTDHVTLYGYAEQDRSKGQLGMVKKGHVALHGHVTDTVLMTKAIPWTNLHR